MPVEAAAEPPYALPNIHVELLCGVEPPGIPTAFWRGVRPDPTMFFVVESFIDELAAACEAGSPWAYRRALARPQSARPWRF